MVVAPAVDNTMASNLGSQLGQFSGLASAAGIRLPDSETVTPFSKFIELIQSEPLADRLQKKYNFLRFFYPGRWDWQANRWRQPSGMFFLVKQSLYEVLGAAPLPNPTAFDLAKLLQTRLTIDLVPKTGMRRISFSSKDPQIALWLLKAIYHEADEMLREDAQERSARQIAYLQQKLQTVTVTEERTALSNLLVVQEQQAMLSQSGLAFSAHLVEQPYVSDRPSSPERSLVLFTALVIGALGGALLALLIAARTKRHGTLTFSQMFMSAGKFARL